MYKLPQDDKQAVHTQTDERQNTINYSKGLKIKIVKLENMTLLISVIIIITSACKDYMHQKILYHFLYKQAANPLAAQPLYYGGIKYIDILFNA